MRCGIFHGASRLPGWRQIIRTSASAASIWSCIDHMMQNERLAGLIKVKTPKGLSHIYSITLTELISQTVPVKAAAPFLQGSNALLTFYYDMTIHTAPLIMPSSLFIHIVCRQQLNTFVHIIQCGTWAIILFHLEP